MHNFRPSVDNLRVLHEEVSQRAPPPAISRPAEPPRSASFDHRLSGASPRERARVRYDSMSAERDAMKFDRSNLMLELMKEKNANDKLQK